MTVSQAKFSNNLSLIQFSSTAAHVIQIRSFANYRLRNAQNTGTHPQRLCYFWFWATKEYCIADVSTKTSVSVGKASVGGNWGKWYTSLDFQKKGEGCTQRGRNRVAGLWGRRRPPHCPGLSLPAPLGGSPSGCHREPADSSPLPHSARSRGARTLLNAVCRVIFTLRSPLPARDWGLSWQALSSTTRPPLQSLLCPRSLLRLRPQPPFPAPLTVCFPAAAHFGRAPMQSPQEIIQTPSYLMAPRNLCAQG